jgi:hypothetical protein
LSGDFFEIVVDSLPAGYTLLLIPLFAPLPPFSLPGKFFFFVFCFFVFFCFCFHSFINSDDVLQMIVGLAPYNMLLNPTLEEGISFLFFSFFSHFFHLFFPF